MLDDVKLNETSLCCGYINVCRGAFGLGQTGKIQQILTLAKVLFFWGGGFKHTNVMGFWLKGVCQGHRVKTTLKGKKKILSFFH